MPLEVLAYADIVIYNGKVLTVDDKFTISQAVAVRDGKFLALGDSAKILQMAGPNTTRIDLKGGTLVPGFYLGHGQGWEGQHQPSGIMHLGNWSRIRFEKLDEGLRKMKELVEKVGRPGEWIFFGAARTAAAYTVTKEMLDTVAPNNPVLMTLDNTTGIVNSKALNTLPNYVMAGIFKDKNGQPTGMIRGWAYGVLTYEVLPYPEGEAYEAMVQRQKEKLIDRMKTGVTTSGNRMWGLTISILRDLYMRGELPLRIRITSEIPRLNPLAEPYLKRIGNLMGVGDDWLKIAAATVSSIDSHVTNGGMFTRKPMRAKESWMAFSDYGYSKWTDMVEEGKDWKEYGDYKNVAIAAKYGYNVTDIHIQGDAGVAQFLDAMDEAAKKYPVKGKAYGIAHGLMRPVDLGRRMAAYEMVLNFNPSYLFQGDGDYVKALDKQWGPDETAGMQPLRELIDIGMKPALETMGTDEEPDVQPSLRIVDPRPAGHVYLKQNQHLEGIEAYVTRKNDALGKVVGPNQRITREEALRMATVWAARFYQDEKTLGSIEPGKLADCVVLGGDYMTVPPEQISELPILNVIIGGKIKYAKN
ncbi:MAG: amidohydrolase family protein [Acidobacteria bacterium]|nr:amidohydrolase family protein [Acidobacteriota bacterium]